MIDGWLVGAIGATAFAAAGLLQACVGWARVQHFARRRGAPCATLPPLTILKPLHGDEPLLEEAIASFCAQDYPKFQIVFGLQDSADPARHVLCRIRARFPDVNMTVVVDPTPHGANRKIANLINMLPSAHHDTLVISDSDIHAAPDYLRQVATSLAQPGTGLVTTLYAGLASSGTLTGRLGATQINHAFLPGALMARVLGRQDCLGATMALTRETLSRIGGLEALANHVADDAVLGQLVLATGQNVALARTVPSTTVPETVLADLFAHELRWARTIQSMAPVGFAMSIVQYPLFWATLALLLSGGAVWALQVMAAAWIARALFAAGIDHALRLPPAAPVWSLPLRDMLSVAVLVASYRSKRVAWRGQVQLVGRPLTPQQGLIT